MEVSWNRGTHQMDCLSWKILFFHGLFRGTPFMETSISPIKTYKNLLNIPLNPRLFPGACSSWAAACAGHGAAFGHPGGCTKWGRGNRGRCVGWHGNDFTKKKTEFNQQTWWFMRENYYYYYYYFLWGLSWSIQKHVDLAQVMAKLVVNMTIKPYQTHQTHWSQFSKWDVTFWNGPTQVDLKRRRRMWLLPCKDWWRTSHRRRAPK